MSRLNNSIYYYATVTIEALSPLVLASGKSGTLFDMELVRDANGLPAIPGTTIAGILRHAVLDGKGKEAEKKLFGYQSKNDGNSSALEVSWGYIHDSKNCIHKSFYPKAEIEKDAILKDLYKKENPDFKRDHVRLSDKGTACDAGKFDRYFVPTGSRFTFSIGLWSAGESESWDDILQILASPSFRIGASGRDGYGKIKVVEIKVPAKKYFDLAKEEDLDSFKNCLEKSELPKIDGSMEVIKLRLRFPRGFRIGCKSSDAFDIRPYSEKVIKWNGDNGDFEAEKKITIPGSALKGALRHRTAYHLARINKKWDWQEAEDDGLSELFGYTANSNDSSAKGKAGKIWFTDLYLDQVKTYQLSRNSIDRFSGGTLNGALFQEENAYVGQTFETCIYLDKTTDKCPDELKAFKWAIEDLKAGRLALGGGSGHGLGFNHAEETN